MQDKKGENQEKIGEGIDKEIRERELEKDLWLEEIHLHIILQQYIFLSHPHVFQILQLSCNDIAISTQLVFLTSFYKTTSQILPVDHLFFSLVTKTPSHTASPKDLNALMTRQVVSYFITSRSVQILLLNFVIFIRQDNKLLQSLSNIVFKLDMLATIIKTTTYLYRFFIITVQ